VVLAKVSFDAYRLTIHNNGKRLAPIPVWVSFKAVYTGQLLGIDFKNFAMNVAPLAWNIEEKWNTFDYHWQLVFGNGLSKKFSAIQVVKITLTAL
jgi:hypothetical protein